jgi:small nuclear ribonucleoprotein (snRNP)-like protein
MKTYDFIKQAIGKKVYITRDGDLMMSGELRGFIANKTPLTLVKLSRKGMAVLADDNGGIYSVRPSNVREINN